jgi:hypothetical protein
LFGLTRKFVMPRCKYEPQAGGGGGVGGWGIWTTCRALTLKHFLPLSPSPRSFFPAL